MGHDLPEWVAELTDPRRAQTLDELADRLVPLAEHAIDVSRRLQAQLGELNEPFQRETLYGRVDRLKERSAEALTEISGEIAASGRERMERVWAAFPAQFQERDAAGLAELRRQVEEAVLPELSHQESSAVEQIGERTTVALTEAIRTLLRRAEELADAVTDIIQDVLPLAKEGLALAGRISSLSSRAREGARGPVPAELRTEAAATAAAFDEAVGRLELEWAALGARSATVRAALRGAEEAAFSQVTVAMTQCVEELAPTHVRVLSEVEAKAISLLDQLTAGR